MAVKYIGDCAWCHRACSDLQPVDEKKYCRRCIFRSWDVKGAEEKMSHTAEQWIGRIALVVSTLCAIYISFVNTAEYAGPVALLFGYWIGCAWTKEECK